MPHLHQLTKCNVQDDKATFFWLDRWITSEPLAARYPAIHSHHLQPNALVCDVLQTGIEAHLRDRLTATAELELASLNTLLQDVQLSDEQDVRTMIDGMPFSAKAAYSALHRPPSSDPTCPLWGSRVPGRVRVFAWLTHLDRLNTRQKLARKNIITEAHYPRCPSQLEDREHLFFSCPAARTVWSAIAMPALSFDMPDLWTSCRHPKLTDSTWTFALISVLWKLWDARNAMVFRQIDQPALVTVKNIVDDLAVWAHRLHNEKHKHTVAQWRDHLTLCTLNM
ncbi:unnamed protein product [Alopecurus aequalis]